MLGLPGALGQRAKNAGHDAEITPRRDEVLRTGEVTVEKGDKVYTVKYEVLNGGVVKAWILAVLMVTMMGCAPTWYDTRDRPASAFPIDRDQCSRQAYSDRTRWGIVSKLAWDEVFAQCMKDRGYKESGK